MGWAGIKTEVGGGCPHQIDQKGVWLYGRIHRHHAPSTLRPNAEREYFLPFGLRGTTTWDQPDESHEIYHWEVNRKRVHSLRYLRQWGFCIWHLERLQRWTVLNHRYGEILDPELRQRWCRWIPRNGGWACCSRGRCPKSNGCRCSETIDPRFEPEWRVVREAPARKKWCVCGCKIGHL